MSWEWNGQLVLVFFPIVGSRRIDVTNGPTAEDLACQIRKLVDDDYPEAVRITLVKDNLNTHVSSSLYKEFYPKEER